ncbi:MAG: hypothetical protein ACP5G4_11115 [bacterium]
MLIFLHNNFVMDFLALRSARLLAIKTYIMAWKDILSIPDHLVSWALNAYDNWVAALAKSQAEMGEERVAYDQMHTADKLTFEYYARCKALVIDTYGENNPKLVIYGATGRFPRDRKRRMDTVQGFLDGHATLVASGDPDVLPDAFIAKLQGYFSDSNNAFNNFVLKEKPEARKAVDAQEELFAIDSEMLRVLYSWVLMTWSKGEPNLVQLGFAPQTGQSGGGGGVVPSAPEGFMLSWLEPFLKATWMPVEGATSYQLAFSADGGGSWEELYSGAEMGFEFEPPAGLRQYRVRARNANGYGEWSVILEYDIEEPAPVGSWPDELSGLYAIFHDFPSPFIEVGHALQDGADGYNLKRVVVAIGDPDPTEEDMPVDNFAEGLTPDPYADAEINPGDKCAYWMCGVQGGVEGDWTGPVIGEYGG